MAADGTTDAPTLDEEEEGGGKSKKKLIIMIVAVLLIVGGGAGFYFLDPLGMFAPEEGEAEVVVEAPKPVFFLPLPEIQVNLSNTDGRRQYLRIKATLELLDKEDITNIEPFMPRVMDAFQVYLRELRTADIEGSAGLFHLKQELQKRINQAVYPVVVQKVLFEEILVQ